MLIHRAAQFRRVTLEAGKRQHLSIALRVGELSHYDAQSRRVTVDAGRYELVLGASSADLRQKAVFDVVPD